MIHWQIIGYGVFSMLIAGFRFDIVYKQMSQKMPVSEVISLSPLYYNWSLLNCHVFILLNIL